MYTFASFGCIPQPSFTGNSIHHPPPISHGHFPPRCLNSSHRPTFAHFSDTPTPHAQKSRPIAVSERPVKWHTFVGAMKIARNPGFSDRHDEWERFPAPSLRELSRPNGRD